MTNAIEIRDINQVYRSGFWLKRVEILKGVSFSVKSGSAVGFVGSNGAGKTSLINIITGLRRPEGGSVKIFGSDPSSKLAKQKIGYLPERPYFYQHLSGQQLLSHLGTLSGYPPSLKAARILEVLEYVGLSDVGTKEISKYSKGMLQRIGIAQSIFHDPELLILDEPMSGLDPIGRREMRDLILDLNQKGKTVFFTSHVLSDVEAIADEVVTISNGRITNSGSIDKFSAKGAFSIELKVLLGADFRESFASKPFIRKFQPLRQIDQYRVVLDVGGKPEHLAAAFKALQDCKAEILSLTTNHDQLESLLRGEIQ